MKVVGIIPARYDSSRFPGKPLVDIGGKSMIRRVYEQVAKSSLSSRVLVATDDQRIFDEVTGFGGRAMFSTGSHTNGTERCAEAIAHLKEPCDYVINIQCDEPFLDPDVIDQLISMLDGQVQLATLITPANPEELPNPNMVKVVINHRMEAMYFSRSCIPHGADRSSHTWYRHIGIYAYRSDILLQVSQLPPGQLETVERLEQLRWLENGYAIKVSVTDHKSISIDRPEDLKLANEYLQLE